MARPYLTSFPFLSSFPLVPQSLRQSVELLRECRDRVQDPLPVRLLQPRAAPLGEPVRVPQRLLSLQQLPEGGQVRAVGPGQHHLQHVRHRAAGGRPWDVPVAQLGAGGRGGGAGPGPALEGCLAFLVIAALLGQAGLLLLALGPGQVLLVLLLQLLVQRLVGLLLFLPLLGALPPLPAGARGGQPLSLCVLFLEILIPDLVGPVSEVLLIVVEGQVIGCKATAVIQWLDYSVFMNGLFSMYSVIEVSFQSIQAEMCYYSVFNQL